MDSEKPAAHRHWLTGFDQRRGAEVDVAETCENADSRDDYRAQKAYNHDLQMRAAVRTIHRMIHHTLRVFRRQLRLPGNTSSFELIGT
jgi:hypothetical protein